MRVLLTNRKLETRSGSELYTRDVAVELLRRGHQPFVFSPVLGDVATEMLDATIPVADDLSAFGSAPDIIHGQHPVPIMAALQWFGDAPAINVSHGWRPDDETPVVHPRVRRYVAVDEAVSDRLELRSGIARDRIDIVPNFVDLTRFRVQSKPDAVPRRMIAFSNYIHEGSEYLEAARGAAAILGLSLDVVGAGVGNPISRPEELLGEYDIVLAQGRSALEAAACGASVVICSSRAFGPLVRSDNFDELRRINFGIRSLVHPATAETLVTQLQAYDAVDATLVADRVRRECGVDRAVDRIEAIYRRVLDDHDTGDRDVQAERRVETAFWLSAHRRSPLSVATAPRAVALAKKLESADRRARAAAHDVRVARSELAALRATRAVRLQQHIRRSRVLRSLYRMARAVVPLTGPGTDEKSSRRSGDT